MKSEIKTAGKPSFWKKIKLLGWILCGTAVFLILFDLAVSGFLIHSWTHPEKITAQTIPSDYGLDYRVFEVETENGTVYGWKIPAQTPVDPDAEEWVSTTEYSDKTVVIAPNYDSNRECLDLGGVDYMVDLCSAGYNVIVFDWTGSGFSDGTKNVFTMDKIEELKAVVAFAAKETGSSFLAVQGIGFGCYPAAVAAAECDGVNALILDSCYEDFEKTFYGNFGTWSSVDLFPVKQTVRLLFPVISGVDVNEVTLADPINALNGTHVLLIQGEGDEIFGSSDVRHLHTLASVDNKAELWLLPNVNHLRARAYDSEGYLSKISGFLSKAYDADHTA
ncbi:MAG: hypothetical protein J6B54_01985 [Clostridia bacterium]|nr:hypothetical protein [Clostridia bacterium]